MHAIQQQPAPMPVRFLGAGSLIPDECPMAYEVMDAEGEIVERAVVVRFFYSPAAPGSRFEPPEPEEIEIIELVGFWVGDEFNPEGARRAAEDAVREFSRVCY